LSNRALLLTLASLAVLCAAAANPVCSQEIAPNAPFTTHPAEHPLESVGVLGEVDRPGVYGLSAGPNTLSDLLQRAGTSRIAKGATIRLLRNGSMGLAELTEETLQFPLHSGDLIVVDGSSPPADARSGEPQGGTPPFQSTPRAESWPDVQLAFVRLFDSPVVSTLPRAEATLANIVQRLGQPAAVAETIRVIPPGQHRLIKPEGHTIYSEPLASGTILVFDPSMLERKALPPAPAVIQPVMLASHDEDVSPPISLVRRDESVIDQFQHEADRPQSTLPAVSPTYVVPLAAPGAGAPGGAMSSTPAEGHDTLPGRPSHGHRTPASPTENSERILGPVPTDSAADDATQPLKKSHDRESRNATRRPKHEAADRAPAPGGLRPEGKLSTAAYWKNSPAVVPFPENENVAADRALSDRHDLVAWIIGGLAGATLLMIVASMILRLFTSRTESTVEQTGAAAAAADASPRTVAEQASSGKHAPRQSAAPARSSGQDRKPGRLRRAITRFTGKGRRAEEQPKDPSADAIPVSPVFTMRRAGAEKPAESRATATAPERRRRGRPMRSRKARAARPAAPAVETQAAAPKPPSRGPSLVVSEAADALGRALSQLQARQRERECA